MSSKRLNVKSLGQSRFAWARGSCYRLGQPYRTGEVPHASCVVRRSPARALLVAQRPYRVKFALRGPADPDRTRLMDAITRGMFIDSLISRATAPPAEHPDYSDPNLSGVVIVEGAMIPQGDSVSLNLRLLNILGQPLARDSAHVARTKLDSVPTEVGRRFAHAVSRR